MKWLQVFAVLFDSYIEPYQVLPLLVRVDQVVMAMKGYSMSPLNSSAEDSLDCLMSYPGYSTWRGSSSSSAKMQSVYSTAPVDCDERDRVKSDQVGGGINTVF